MNNEANLGVQTECLVRKRLYLGNYFEIQRKRGHPMTRTTTLSFLCIFRSFNYEKGFLYKFIIFGIKVTCTRMFS